MEPLAPSATEMGALACIISCRASKVVPEVEAGKFPIGGNANLSSRGSGSLSPLNPVAICSVFTTCLRAYDRLKIFHTRHDLAGFWARCSALTLPHSKFRMPPACSIRAIFSPICRIGSFISADVAAALAHGLALSPPRSFGVQPSRWRLLPTQLHCGRLLQTSSRLPMLLRHRLFFDLLRSLHLELSSRVTGCFGQIDDRVAQGSLRCVALAS